MDAYNGKSLPDELTTKEFFEDLKTIGKPEGIVFNFILDSGLKSDLANNVLTTVSDVFGETWTKNVSQNPALTFDNFVATVVSPDDTYKYYTPIGKLYTDDQRSTETDLAMMRHGTQ